MYAQELKTAKENTSLGQAKFTVLKSDMSTKHGKYQLTGSSSKKILIDGNYKLGKKHGPWIERFDKVDAGIKCLGNYEDDEKTGDWTYYNPQGDVIQVYNHTANEIVKSTDCEQGGSHEYYLNGMALQGLLDCPPTIVGGVSNFKDELIHGILNRPSSKKKGQAPISMNVKVSFFIDTNGLVEPVRYAPHVEDKDLRYFIETEIYAREGDWIAATKNQEKVRAKLILPLSF